MTKAEIASEIAKATGIDKAAVVTIIEQFMNVVIGQNYRSNVEDSRYYTDGMLRQFNSIYRLISNQ